MMMDDYDDDDDDDGVDDDDDDDDDEMMLMIFKCHSHLFIPNNQGTIGCTLTVYPWYLGILGDKNP